MRLLTVLFLSLSSGFATAKKVPVAFADLSQFPRYEVRGHQLEHLIGTTFFAPHGWLRTTQTTFSDLSADTKLLKHSEELQAPWLPQQKRYLLRFNGGLSFLSDAKPATAILGPDGIYIIDGNHRIIESFKAGALSAPVRLVPIEQIIAGEKAWHKLPQAEFQQKMLDYRLAYLKYPDGQLAKRFVNYAEMMDHPLRDLVVRLTLRLSGKTNEIKSVVNAVEHPVLIKVGDSFAFFELYIADFLYQAGIRWNPRWENHIPDSIVEKCRALIVNARKQGHPILQYIYIIGGNRIRPQDLNFKNIVAHSKKMTQQFECGKALSDGD